MLYQLSSSHIRPTLVRSGNVKPGLDPPVKSGQVRPDQFISTEFKQILTSNALKKHSVEAINVLIYVAKLVAKDPKLAFAKRKEESARRVVHFINYNSDFISKIPTKVVASVSPFLHFADSSVTSVHMDGVQRALVSSLKTQAHHFTLLLKQVNVYITHLLCGDEWTKTGEFVEVRLGAGTAICRNVAPVSPTHELNVATLQRKDRRRE
ncbi:hypothetical protein Zmor_000231 [Zophobas morio]|uniref:Uncharacterized protein n=1 Tax=Zophobas morio TaxID=2755281 RepID=A0AA38J0D9_9CUCU|nr:hypothetical protein Zmor_000231 [Zophobas morio]